MPNNATDENPFVDFSRTVSPASSSSFICTYCSVLSYCFAFGLCFAELNLVKPMRVDHPCPCAASESDRATQITKIKVSQIRIIDEYMGFLMYLCDIHTFNVLSPFRWRSLHPIYYSSSLLLFDETKEKSRIKSVACACDFIII